MRIFPQSDVLLSDQKPLPLCPSSKRLRERLRAMASDLASSWRSQGIPSDAKKKGGLRKYAEMLIQRVAAERAFVGWTMVTLVSEFWRMQLSAGPSGRRLLLLPDCPLAAGRSLDGTPHVCGPHCTIATIWTAARDSGWVVESSSIAVDAIGHLMSGQYDGILGVACLKDLEQAFSRLPVFSIPVAAVPFEPVQEHQFSCCSDAASAQTLDVDWVLGLLGVAGGAVAPVGDYLPLLREAAEMFTEDALHHRLEKIGIKNLRCHGTRSDFSGVPPLDSTGLLACDFLCRGGKFLRPFITLAIFDALMADTHGSGLQSSAVSRDAVKSCAVAIEVFHKASLIHDDIEDHDEKRYGRPTMHVEFGLPCAVNVGDFLIGLGYRLVSGLQRIDQSTQNDAVSLLANAHMRLAQGQGAELWWRDQASKKLSPEESLSIYGLKTSPAFEVAILMGMRLAGIYPNHFGDVRDFAYYIGTGFQILNDLKDWSGDLENDRQAAGDLLGGRPTLMWALAMKYLNEKDRQELSQIAHHSPSNDRPRKFESRSISDAKRLFVKADVFRRAEEILSDQRRKASFSISSCKHARVREVLEFLLDLAVPEQVESNMVS